MAESATDPTAIAVPDRVRLGDLLWFATAAVLIAVTPWMFISSAGETAEYRTEQGSYAETPVAFPLAIFLLIVLAWAGTKAYFLLRRPVVARIGSEGVRLFPEGVRGLRRRQDTPAVDVPWNEVRRLILWDRSEKLLFFIPGKRTQLGVEKINDAYSVVQKEPTEQQRQSRDHRDNGSPVRLGSMLLSRSVEFPPRGAKAVATAVAAFAPNVQVLDERRFGKPQVVEPAPRRSPMR